MDILCSLKLNWAINPDLTQENLIVSAFKNVYNIMRIIVIVVIDTQNQKRHSWNPSV